MKASLIALALVLTACGTDGPENNDPKPVTASAVLGSRMHPEYVNLDLTGEVAGCEFEVSIHDMEISDVAVTVGGRVLALKDHTDRGTLYTSSEGGVTRSLEQVADKWLVGLSCYRPEDFR